MFVQVNPKLFSNCFVVLLVPQTQIHTWGLVFPGEPVNICWETVYSEVPKIIEDISSDTKIEASTESPTAPCLQLSM